MQCLNIQSKTVTTILQFITCVPSPRSVGAQMMQRRSLDSSGAETPSDTQQGLPLTEVLAPQCWHSLIDEKKGIHSGSEECGKIVYTTETVVFPPRLRKAKENLKGLAEHLYIFSLSCRHLQECNIKTSFNDTLLIDPKYHEKPF